MSFFSLLDFYYEITFAARADDVYTEVKASARGAILQLIEKEREGEQIDRALLKNVLGIFIEVGMGGMDCYANDFETQLIAESGAHYKRKATAWIAVRSPAVSPACLFMAALAQLSKDMNSVGSTS